MQIGKARQKEAEDRNRPNETATTEEIMMVVANVCQIIELVARSLVNHSASHTNQISRGTDVVEAVPCYY